jgi:hypothetical protein
LNPSRFPNRDGRNLAGCQSCIYVNPAVSRRAARATGQVLTASATRDAGFEILRGVVPLAAVDRLLRHVHLDIVREGLPQVSLSEWLWNAHWFPHLKWDDEVVALVEHLPPELRKGDLCDPQILLQMPDESEDVELVPHVDQIPDWADGRSYTRIVGVALTRNEPVNGGVHVWPLDGRPAQPVELDPGDVLVMDPLLPHASGLNRTGGIRYAVYFRFLQAS